MNFIVKTKIIKQKHFFILKYGKKIIISLICKTIFKLKIHRKLKNMIYQADNKKNKVQKDISFDSLPRFSYQSIILKAPIYQRKHQSVYKAEYEGKEISVIITAPICGESNIENTVSFIQSIINKKHPGIVELIGYDYDCFVFQDNQLLCDFFLYFEEIYLKIEDFMKSNQNYFKKKLLVFICSHP